MGPIILSGQDNATNTDILQGTRLQTVPAGGVLTFELQANKNDVSNFFAVSIQMPNAGKVQIDPRTGRVSVCKTRRRGKRLATTSDIKDLAALKSVLSPADLKTRIATHPS